MSVDVSGPPVPAAWVVDDDPGYSLYKTTEPDAVTDALLAMIATAPALTFTAAGAAHRYDFAQPAHTRALLALKFERMCGALRS